MCALLFFFLTLKKGKDSKDRQLPLKAKLKHMDPLGATSLIAAVCCLLLALHWGGATLSWSSSRVIGLFVGFGLLIVAFGALQWKLGERATIPLRVLRQRSVLMGSLFLFFVNMTLFAVRLDSDPAPLEQN